MDSDYECCACGGECPPEDAITCTSCGDGYCVKCAPVHLTPYNQESLYAYFRNCIYCFDARFYDTVRLSPNWTSDVWPGCDINQWVIDCRNANAVNDLTKGVQDLSLKLKVETDSEDNSEDDSEDYEMDYEMDSP